jgi:hypothetical protein
MIHLELPELLIMQASMPGISSPAMGAAVTIAGTLGSTCHGTDSDCAISRVPNDEIRVIP